jgi:hypothetical protein
MQALTGWWQIGQLGIGFGGGFGAGFGSTSSGPVLFFATGAPVTQGGWR